MNKVNVVDQKIVIWMAFAGIIFALYVALGAFGAHGLENKLTTAQSNTYQTALRYLVLHAIGLLLVNISFGMLNKSNDWVNWLFVGGMVLFSLSLLIHACKDLLGVSVNVFALIAPLGGLSYIAGWIIYAITLLKK